MAAVGCAYKAQLGVLWRVGATVIVHSCVHNEDQPWAGFISCSAFSARLFFFFPPPPLLAILPAFENKKGGTGCFSAALRSRRRSSALWRKALGSYR